MKHLFTTALVTAAFALPLRCRRAGALSDAQSGPAEPGSRRPMSKICRSRRATTPPLCRTRPSRSICATLNLPANSRRCPITCAGAPASRRG